MGRKRKLTANEIIDSINNTAPKIIFYTDKISIRLKKYYSIAFWKRKLLNSKLDLVSHKSTNFFSWFGGT